MKVGNVPQLVSVGCYSTSSVGVQSGGIRRLIVDTLHDVNLTLKRDTNNEEYPFCHENKTDSIGPRVSKCPDCWPRSEMPQHSCVTL